MVLLLAQKEVYWQEKLLQIEPLSLTYFEQAAVDLSLKNHAATEKEWRIFLGDWAGWTEKQWIAALITGFARMSHQDTFSMSTAHPEIFLMIDPLKKTPADSTFSSRVPFQYQIDLTRTFEENCAIIAESCQQQVAKGTFSQALIENLNDTTGRVLAWQNERHDVALSWVMSDEAEKEVAANAKLHIIFNFQSGEMIWRYLSSEEESIQALKVLLQAWVQSLQHHPVSIAEVPFLTKEGEAFLDSLNQTDCFIPWFTVPELFEQQVVKTPDAIALVANQITLTYAQLNAKANQVAHTLIALGIEREGRVGVLLDRSQWMVIVLLAVQKAGAAYVPMDPSYPVDRLKWMAEDSGVRKIITRFDLTALLPEFASEFLVLENPLHFNWASLSVENPQVGLLPENLIYVMYTSGSTGKPKGVMVEHRNIVNFMLAMDEHIYEKTGVFCSVTSMSFDISVLELYWSLTRGFKVVLYRDPFSDARKTENIQKNQFALNTQKVDGNTIQKIDVSGSAQKMDFSLFFWNQASDASINDTNKYQLLLSVAEAADSLGFKALWVPERHFGTFGGNYPNPSVVGAALAIHTKNIQIRAGSCVLPLHHPVRVAEEWSVVDNLSQGRVGIAFASGWQPNDFVLMPENFDRPRSAFYQEVESVRKLWRGDTVEFKGPKGMVSVKTLPKPIQPELPYWITAAANPETFKKAGEMGAGILTHLLGQSIETLVGNIQVYQTAWKNAGFQGQGNITLMLHTLVGETEEAVRHVVREPLKAYLKSAVALLKDAAWESPTFKKMSREAEQTVDAYFEQMSAEELDAILEFAFERYYERSGLFGSIERATNMVERLRSIGVTEIACLVDYGLTESDILAHLPYLAMLMNPAQLNQAVIDQQSVITSHGMNEAVFEPTLAELCLAHGVTHFQCTPSQGRMLLEDETGLAALRQLKYFLMGGEALPKPLAGSLCQAMPSGRLINVYGPTETTVWSTCFHIKGHESQIPIGRPIANTRVYVLDRFHRRVPVGVAGELGIGGAGVVRGYFNRKELTDERFIPESRVTGRAESGRVYCTGDLVRLREDGILEYLGRTDYQVKIRGFRIELGEIESVISAFPSVASVAVVIKTVGDHRQLIAFATENKKQPEKLCTRALKKFIQSHLPDFMVPSPIVILDHMPLTPNGKINRLALPDPLSLVEEVKEASLPKSETEKQVALVWCQALGREAVSAYDNFFDIGGHSLLVVKVLTELKKIFTKPLVLTDLFRYTTVKQLAEYLGDAQAVEAVKSERLDETRQRAIARRELLKNRRR